MEAAEKKTAPQEAQPLDKLYMENTLLRVAGVLFCHDAKRAASRTDEIEINKGVQEKNVIVRPDPRLGQPGPLAHKLFVAVIKKHSDYGRPVQNEVSFTKREIMRLIGRKEWGGRDSAELAVALKEIRYTHIIAFFKNKDRFIEHDFSIFNEILLERRASHSDPIEACTVVLADSIINSLKDDHFTCLNFFLMQRLGTIGQALYMRLFFHFANLYDGHHKKRLVFQKHYGDICVEWLGGLKVLQYKSDILKDQLGSHLRHLTNAGFLASYGIQPAKNREGFVITFRPGAAFFLDYDRFYRHRHQGELQFDFHGDRQNISEPLKVAYLFVQKRTGQATSTIPGISSKDRETAQQLLETIPFEEMEGFIDYALGEAKKTKFDPQSLGGLKQYVPRYLQTREHRAKAKATEAARQARERQESDRIAYDRYRRTQAQQLFLALPSEEQGIIDGLARTNSGSGFAASNGSLAKTLYEISRARITAERHPDKVPSFDHWTTTRTAS